MRALAIALFFCGLAAAAAANDPPPGALGPRDVLVLHSFHPGYVWTEAVNDGIENTFLETAPEVALFTEYMDTKRHRNDDYVEELSRVFALKYAHQSFDLIIACDDPAVSFVTLHRNDIFHGAPVVAVGTRTPERFMDENNRDLRAVVERPALEENLRLVATLLPRCNTIVALGTPSLANSPALEMVRQTIADQGYSYDVFVEVSSDMKALAAKYASLGDTVLFVGFDSLREPDGRWVPLTESQQALARFTSAPQMALADVFVTEATLGGCVIDSKAYGELAAKLAIETLAAPEMTAGRTVAETPMRYLFQYPQLVRLNISPGALPPNSEVLNSPISFLERHRIPLFWGGVVFGVQTLLLAWLAITGARTRRAYYALDQSERRYRTLFSATKDLVLVAGVGEDGDDTQFIEVNRTACSRLGYARHEFWDMEPRDIMRPEDGAIWDEAMRTVRERGSALFEVTVVPREGHPFSVEVLASRTDYLGAEAVFAICRDLSERHAAEAALRTSEARLGFALEATHAGLWDWDVKENRGYFSPALFTLFGYEPDGFPVNYAGWKEHVHPDDLDATRATLQRLISGQVPGFDWEYRFRCADGSYKWVLARGKTIEHDAQGKVTRIIGTLIDIDERKEAERRRDEFEQQVQQAQKLESLGVLAGGIAHDFNNLLTGILGNTELAGRHVSDAKAKRHLAEIQNASLRAAELCRQMLAYSGRGAFHVAPLNINDVVHEMANLLQASISKKAELTMQLAPNPPYIEADVTQIRQVVMNLITNASDALGENSGTITLTTGQRVYDAEEITGLFPARPEPGVAYVYLEVADTGCGMSSETLARMFEPFFSTKFTGRGLGLAALLGIVRAHKGAVRVESYPNRGTRIRVLFPAASAGTSLPEEPPRLTTEIAADGAVLVIDDEAMVRAVARDMLEMAGFEVLTAANGREALAVVEKLGSRLRAILLDMTMPEMDGLETLQQLRARGCNVPVVLTSGYSEQEALDRFDTGGLAGFVQKPFALNPLLEALGAACRLPVKT